MQESALEMNGNGLPNGNGLKAFSFSFFGRLFNIGPSQWSRVAECWFITLFFKIGSAIGWTVLTAAFVSHFGIVFLPTLFVLNAVLIILSTLYFEKLIMRMKREILMILMVLMAAICLLVASVMYERSYMAFFALVIFAESIFLAQFNVFIPILVGDRFTPLESQTTFPFVESAETIGGVIGGTLVGIFATTLPVQIFLYLWIGFLACIIFVFVIANYVTATLPPFPVRVKDESRKKKDQIKLIVHSIKQIPFLKGLVIMVLLQWVFMNILELQYTKAIQQTITRRNEPTIAMVEPKSLKADVLSSDKNVSVAASNNPDRALTVTEQAVLTEKLGIFRSIFHAGALIVQIFIASRLITALGVVGSLLIHPILVLMSLVGMFLKFGLPASVAAKFTFESTNVIHKNAYFSSHYVFPKSIRDQAAEFLEGIVRPMGTIVGMLSVLVLQMLFAGKELSMWIHIIMFLIMVAILITTIRLQPKYTRLSRDQLFSTLPYPEKLNAIEILSQRGHKDVGEILVQKLREAEQKDCEESTIVRIKLLTALGRLKDYSTLPDILEILYDKNFEVRLEAAHALMNFYDIGEKFYSQAFSRHRMVETLKDVFKKEESATVRSAIIRVFSLIRQPDIVSFLLEMLSSDDSKVRADCVYTLGLFHDMNASYYITPLLNDGDINVRANALIALNQFPKNSPLVESEINKMLNSNDENQIKAAIFVIGEIGLAKKKRYLHELLHNGASDVQMEASFALTKLADPYGFHSLLQRFLFVPREQFESLRRFFNRLKPKAKHMAEKVLTHFIVNHLNEIMKEYGVKSLHQVDAPVLEKLRRLYKLLDQHEELYAIEEAIKKQIVSPITTN